MINVNSLMHIEGLTILKDEPLSKYTGFRTGGPSTVLIPDTLECFISTIRSLKDNRLPFYVLGNGSNVLALDEGYDGFIVLTKKALNSIVVDGSSIKSGSGCMLIEVCRSALSHSLSGLEFAYGIPGTIGGAVYMNAGAYGDEICSVIKKVQILDDNCAIRDLDKDELDLGYRHSIFQNHKEWIILSAELALNPGNPKDISDRMKELLQRRKDKQPLEFPSCGSTFKRPEGSFASKLIDECGLKGYRIGGAAVSEKHAGFVINLDSATSKDILDLCLNIQKIVRDDTGFNLELEVELLK